MHAGTAKSNITPEVGIYFAGDGAYQSTRFHDLLFARALFLSTENRWVALISADILGIEQEQVRNIRNKMSHRGTGKPGSFFVGCTHTRNGPPTVFPWEAALKYRDEEYIEQLEDTVVDDVVGANEAREPESLCCAYGLASKSFDRRITMPNGETLFCGARFMKSPPQRGAGESPQHHGSRTRGGTATGHQRKCRTHTRTLRHPAMTVSMHKHAISAYFPSPLVQQLEDRYRALVIFLQGACGDLSLKGIFEGYARQKAMGQVLREETIEALAKAVPPVTNPELAVVQRQLSLPVDVSRRPGVLPAFKGALDARFEFNEELFGDAYHCETGAISIGPIAFVTCPGEFLFEPGLKIKWNSPFLRTYVLGNCNDYATYLAYRRAYLEGEYKGDYGQCLKSEACELIVQTTLELLRELV